MDSYRFTQGKYSITRHMTEARAKEFAIEITWQNACATKLDRKAPTHRLDWIEIGTYDLNESLGKVTMS